MGLIIDCPSVLGRTRARGHTRHESVEMLPAKSLIRERADTGDLAEPDRDPRELLLVQPGSAKANDLMSPSHEGSQSRLADGTGGPKQ